MSTIKIVALVVAGMLLSSCSIFMAATQPGPKDLAVLTEGTSRPQVAAALGTPAWAGKNDQGLDVEVFQFVQGYSGGVKAARTTWHLAADVFSIGLWELIGTPIESSYSGTKMNAVVIYDEHQKVKSVRLQDIHGNPIPLEKEREE
ncbi:hypothetical protein [Candidatus Methylomirabilis sp.]|uniref:Lipoprotein n=1 Tax=Candidatus Methylomirabilis tolerans TaxID=3123416 RepID=A0AAJ1AJV4_9BACT|nr:hypothetical protein [Candidatus Methylomirabilis sp.]